MDWKHEYPAANFTGVSVYANDKSYCIADVDDLDMAVEDFCMEYDIMDGRMGTIIMLTVELWQGGDVVDVDDLVFRITERGIEEE